MKTKKIDVLTQVASPLSAAIALALMAPATHAATYVVDSVKRVDGFSFNEALEASMESEEDDRIEFAASLKGATISMSGAYAYSEEGEGTGSLTIDGSGAEGLTIKMFEGEGDGGFGVYNSSISINNLNLVIDRPNNYHGGPFSNTAFFVKYGGELNLEDVVLSQASTNQGSATGIRVGKYSDLTMKNVVIDGSGEGEGIYGGILATVNSDVTIDRVILNDVNTGIIALQSTDSEYGGSGVMNIDISNTIFSNNEDVGLAVFSKYEDEGEGGVLTNLSIMNSTFSDSGLGIAMFAEEYADTKISAEIFNTSIVNNSKYDGESEGASALLVYGNVDLNISHTTITGNTAGKEGAVDGPEEGEGIYGEVAVRIEQYYSTELSISNSIIAGNSASKYIDSETGYSFEPSDIIIVGYNEGEGVVVSSLIGKDHLLDEGEGAADSDLYGEGVIYGKDPLFKDTGLKYNKNSETPTLCLTKDSPAINAADASIAKALDLELDQAGKKRLSDKAPDMGSVEYSTTCKNESKDSSGLFGSFGTLSLASILSLAWIRRRKS